MIKYKIYLLQQTKGWISLAVDILELVSDCYEERTYEDGSKLYFKNGHRITKAFFDKNVNDKSPKESLKDG